MQILTICQILEGVHAKNLQATILFVDFTKAFDFIHRRKMEQILLAYDLPKETVAAIMMLYRNMKVKVCSPDGDTYNFNIVAGVLQGDTLASYFFIICLDYMLRTFIDWMKENGFKLTKERSRRYPHINNYRLHWWHWCLWCNCYRRRNCTRRHEFKSWTKVIAFHIALIPLGKVWIQLFSLQLWVNSRAD